MVSSVPNIRAGTVIDFIGSEVSWSILKCEDKWYVMASHSGATDDTFKFSRAGKKLDQVVARVGKDLWRHGPKWIRTWDRRTRKRKVRL